MRERVFIQAVGLERGSEHNILGTLTRSLRLRSRRKASRSKMQLRASRARCFLEWPCVECSRYNASCTISKKATSQLFQHGSGRDEYRSGDLRRRARTGMESAKAALMLMWSEEHVEGHVHRATRLRRDRINRIISTRL
jgi:hypothetical protein